jgi:phenylpyruvate tautomerase PptA (4-oxalocrotonate tautomerase family)
MSPKSFTFKLTVPRDPHAEPIVAGVAGHAVTYAELDAAAGAEFVTRVTAAAVKALSAPGQPSIHIVVTSDATALSFAIDAVSVSANHA